MGRKRAAIPSYRLHKQSGQADVTLTDPIGRRRDVLLGPHVTPESRAEYRRVLAEWEAAGRSLPPKSPADDTSPGDPKCSSVAAGPHTVTVAPDAASPRTR